MVRPKPHEHPTVPMDLVKRAWKEAPVGTSHMDGYRVTKDKKMLVVSSTPPAKIPRDKKIDSRIVVFPKPEHIDEFKTVAETTAHHGPSWYNPGGVGSLVFRPDSPRTFPIDHIQAHFMVDGNRALKGEKGIRRALATQYGGWRRRAIKELFDIAREQGKEIEVPESLFWTENIIKNRKRELLKKEFDEICENEAGSTRGEFIKIITPKPRG